MFIKEKKKLKLPSTCENFVIFALKQFSLCFINIFFYENVEKIEKKFRVVFSERVGRVTVNTTFFSPKKEMGD